MKKFHLAIILLLLLPGCWGRYPAELTDLGTETFTATEYISEPYQQTRVRHNNTISISKTRYYVVMETANGKYRYHKSVATLQKALEETGSGRRRPLSVEHQVFEDPATDDLYFMETGMPKEQAIEELKDGHGYRQEKQENME